MRYDGVDLYANPGTFRSVLGYVPQDDIIHADLPLERMLGYAARLRFPSSTSATEIADAVSDALGAVGLTESGDVRVAALSGGQRKRASIAVELLTDPQVFFLDEPTSGLDPVTSAEIVDRLRQLADRSATVVFTTHSVEDLVQCDRIVFMMRGGRVGFVGTLDDALAQFGGRLRHRALPSPRRSERRCRHLRHLAHVRHRGGPRQRSGRRGQSARGERADAVARPRPAGRSRHWYATA